ncbi:MAG TPA: serine hydrolase, partial [Segetibacter sp.]
MKTTKLLMLCLIIAQGSFCQSATSPDLVQKTDKLIKEAWDKGIFSGSVAIAKDGKVIYNKNYGYADWTNKKPINRKTLFDIGSINKRFTEEIINQLIKEG